MWNIIAHVLCFVVGTMFGVFLMCLMQAGRQADEQMNEMEKEAGRL